MLGQRGYLPLKDFQGVQDYRVVQCEEMVVLAMALQRCAIHSRMPPGVLCRAVQELHRCLTSLLEKANLLYLEMLDMVRKDHMTPAPAERASSLIPRVEQPISVPTPNELPASEPEEAAQSEELALVQRRRPLAPTGFILSWVDESGPPPIEEAKWPVTIPLGILWGAQLDHTSLGSLQVTVSHYLVKGGYNISAKPRSLLRHPYN